jgi:hypothetical protein
MFFFTKTNKTFNYISIKSFRYTVLGRRIRACRFVHNALFLTERVLFRASKLFYVVYSKDLN